MKKRFYTTICAILLVLTMSIALFACKDPNNGNNGDNYDGNFTMTREIADSILAEIDFGNKLFVTQGDEEGGYNIDGDSFVVYKKYDDGEEIYCGGSGEDFYKVMIKDGEKSYIRLTKWEARLVLEEIKADTKNYLTLLNTDYFNAMLQSAKEYGTEFGNIDVSGSGYREKPEDIIPQTGEIIFSTNVVQSNTAVCIKLGYYFSENRLAYINTSSSLSVEGYIPDNIRTVYDQTDTLSFDYNRTLTMPSDKGKDVTPSDTVNVYMSGSSLPQLNDQLRGSKITLEVPEDDGVFLGWYYDEDYQYKIEGQYQVGYEDYSSTVYAKWQVPAVNVQLNGGTLSEAGQSTLSKCVFVRDLGNVIPYKKGYSFDDWYIDEDFENSIWSDYGKIKADTVVYAKWEPLIKITLSADINYKLPQLIGIEGDKTRLNNVVPSKRGGIFKGWYKDSTFQTPVTRNDFPSADVTYYAKFDDAICVDINFENAVLTTNIDKYINIPLTESEKFGFEDFMYYISQGYYGSWTGEGEGFDGWYTDHALTNPLTAYPTGDITIYPKIAPLYYYRINSGEGTLEGIYSDTIICINWLRAQSIPVADALTDIQQDYIIPPEGKAFAGWYTDAALTTPYQPSAYPTQNTTIYAAYTDA